MLVGFAAATVVAAIVVGTGTFVALRPRAAAPAATPGGHEDLAIADAAREREYWAEVVRATIGTGDLCKGRPNPVDVGYRLGRTGAADVPEPGKSHQYALPIALAVAVGRAGNDEHEHDDDQPEMTVSDLCTFDHERGHIVFFRASVHEHEEDHERSVAVARLPKAISDNMARRLLLFATNRRQAMTWDVHDCSELWGGPLAEQFTVNTGFPPGAKKVLSPPMVAHLVATRADGWIMAGEWLFVHREDVWTDEDIRAVADEMVTFLDLMPPAPRPSNEPLAFRPPLDEWERELVTLIEVREGILERRVQEERRRGALDRRQVDRRQPPPEPLAAS